MLFQKMIKELNVCNQYVSYLIQRKEYFPAEDVETLNGRTTPGFPKLQDDFTETCLFAVADKSDDAAMRRYEFAVKSKDVTKKINELESCLKCVMSQKQFPAHILCRLVIHTSAFVAFRSHFQLDEKLASEAAHISSQIDLLRQQQVVEVSHMSALP